MNDDILVVILARGGSKGVHLKNLQKVGGITLIRRCTLVALSLNVKKIIVSTDSSEIENELVDMDVTIFRRSRVHASDFSKSEDAILEVLNGIDHSNFKFIVFLQPTSPFINPVDVRTAINLIKSEPNVSFFSAVQEHKFAWIESNNNWIPKGFDLKDRAPRQELELVAIETGGFWVFNKESFMIQKTRFCGNPRPLIVNKMYSYEIDDYEDLATANDICNRVDSRLSHLSNFTKN